MYLSGEPVDTSLRGNRLLGHLKNIIEAGERLEMGQGFLVGSIDLLTHCLSLQETGRKHLQAMQRTKSDADWLWLTDLVREIYCPVIYGLPYKPLQGSCH